MQISESQFTFNNAHIHYTFTTAWVQNNQAFWSHYRWLLVGQCNIYVLVYSDSLNRGRNRSAYSENNVFLLIAIQRRIRGLLHVMLRFFAASLSTDSLTGTLSVARRVGGTINRQIAVAVSRW